MSSERAPAPRRTPRPAGPIRARRAGVRAAVAVLALAGAVGAAGTAAAQVVGVVRTADGIPVFEQAIAQMKKTAGGSFEEDSLAADPGRWGKVRERLGKKTPAVWVPVGPLALKLATEAPLGAHVVFMMVPSPETTVGPAGAGAIGVSLRVPASLRLKEMKALLPSVSRVGVLYDPSATQAEVDAAGKAASGLGLTLVTREVKDVRELGAALSALLEQKIDVLWLVADRTVTPPDNREAFEYIAANTLQRGIPVVGYASKFTKAGALLSVEPDYADIGAQAGEIVKKVLAGTPPEQIGVQDARRVSLSINRKVASTLGVSLSPDAYARAAEVFE